MSLLTTQNLQDQLKARKSSALELTQDALARARDPQGEGSRVFTQLDEERALTMARVSDELRATGMARSALEGIPISIKDNLDVAGQVTTAGSTVLKHAEPAQQNASVVDRLIAAGAVIVGRSNMTEFAFSGLGLNPHYGTPQNPWDRATGRIPGGSSSGAAISVTDGMAVLAIGTDTGGSVRIPSALCGLTGFKPTQSRIPNDGALPLSPSLDCIGPLAANVSDCIITDAILAGQQAPSWPGIRPLRGARLAVPQTVVLDRMDETVAKVYAQALARLSRAGALLTELPLTEFAEFATLHIQAKGSLPAAEAWHWHRQLLQEHAAEYDPRVAHRMNKGGEMMAADYIELTAARKRWAASIRSTLRPFDAMIMPTVPVIAPPVAPLQADDKLYGRSNALILRNPTLINFLDGCALSLPCHEPGQAPVGLTIAGTHGQDASILSLGLAIEAVFQTRV